jgi:hypothetical protein
MTETVIRPGLVEIDGAMRVERGPERKRAIATAALLDNANTARHYKLGGIDADGQVIAEGRDMTYLDWTNKDEWGWYVYALEDGAWTEKTYLHGDQAAAVAGARAIGGAN